MLGNILIIVCIGVFIMACIIGALDGYKVTLIAIVKEEKITKAIMTTFTMSTLFGLRTWDIDVYQKTEHYIGNVNTIYYTQEAGIVVYNLHSKVEKFRNRQQAIVNKTRKAKEVLAEAEKMQNYLTEAKEYEIEKLLLDGKGPDKQPITGCPSKLQIRLNANGFTGGPHVRK